MIWRHVSPLFFLLGRLSACRAPPPADGPPRLHRHELLSVPIVHVNDLLVRGFHDLHGGVALRPVVIRGRHGNRGFLVFFRNNTGDGFLHCGPDVWRHSPTAASQPLPLQLLLFRSRGLVIRVGLDWVHGRWRQQQWDQDGGTHGQRLADKLLHPWLRVRGQFRSWSCSVWHGERGWTWLTAGRRRACVRWL